MISDEKLLETLNRSRLYQDYERNHVKATGMPLTLRPVEGRTLALRGKRGENRFCAMMVRKMRTCVACVQAQKHLTEAATDAACTASCAYGLSELAVPVRLGAKTIGLLETGQVKLSTPNSKAFQGAVENAGELGMDIDTPAVREAYFATPVIPQERLNDVAGELRLFAYFLATNMKQIGFETKHGESPAFAKAESSVKEHKRQNPSIAGVAAAVELSPFKRMSREFAERSHPEYREEVLKTSAGVNA